MHDEAGSNHQCRLAGHRKGNRAVAWAIRGVVGTLCLLVHGCDAVNGGAVELSWKLRPASSSLSDKFVECDLEKYGAGSVTGIRLHWRVVGQDGGSIEGSQAWRCEFNHGVTGFDLPEGTADLWVTPDCGPDEAAPGTYIAPARVQRDVIRGDTVSLGAIELVVSVSYCDLQSCICVRR